ncbi:MAG: MBL fold metallo-hydrolase [Candidatus Hodarchaeales archaeon]|jgi:glyoxylase-like metal-dependent hydrolase (beta-lactamase superfamily II)
MTAKREPGKINDDTTLIDFGFSDVSGTGAVYLIESGKTCLIDGGTSAGAPRIIKELRRLDAFPPDYIVLTHSHWDHCQGVPLLREKATKEQKSIEVFASEAAIPLLLDQSYNSVFHSKDKYQNIEHVNPLKEGDTLDLGDIILQVYSTPGHTKDQISLLDKKNKNLFVGDSIGMKVGDNAFLSSIMPPFCNKDDFSSTIQKVKQIVYESISLAHFGYIYDNEAKNILNEAQRIFNQTWNIFESAEQINKLDDIDYIFQVIMNEIKPTIPEFELLKSSMRIMLKTINSFRRIIGKKPISTATLMMRDVLQWQIDGYKLAKNSS